MAELIDVPTGLAGVAVTETEVADVVGDLGFYHYRGRSAPDLARTSDFETVAGLLLSEAAEPLRSERRLPDSTAAIVGQLDIRSALSALGMGLALRPLDELDDDERLDEAMRLIGAVPTVIASALHGRAIDPDPALGHVADYLRMMTGAPADDEHVEALEAYAVLTMDHGFANSTFATRVVASAGGDLAACVLAGYGALSGPRHGANVERILEMYDEIGEPGRAEAWLKSEVAGGRRLQGFGHSVYRKTDPRLGLLREIGSRLAPERYEMACAVEQAGLRVLAGRPSIAPNVDLHAPIVVEACGIPRGWFTPTFAMARVVGWCAHAIEQVGERKLMRPAARYVGLPPDIDVY